MPFYFANKGNIHLNKILPQLFPLWAFELFFLQKTCMPLARMLKTSSKRHLRRVSFKAVPQATFNKAGTRHIEMHLVVIINVDLRTAVCIDIKPEF